MGKEKKSEIGSDSRVNFARILGEMNETTSNLIRNFDFSYRKISEVERDVLLMRYVDALITPKTPSGEGYRAIWEQGWSENLRDFNSSSSLECLIPKFVKRGDYIRFGGQWIYPFNGDFETNFVRVLRDHYFRKYFSSVDLLIEVGPGPGLNSVHFLELFPEKCVLGLDWSDSAIELMNRIREVKGLSIFGVKFDMFSPIEFDKIVGDSRLRVGILSVGAFEQLGTSYEKMLFWCLSSAQIEVVFHMETNYEAYDVRSLFDSLPMRYIEKRNWLRGYFKTLQQLSDQGALSILESVKTFGSFFHDGYSVGIWRPNRPGASIEEN